MIFEKKPVNILLIIFEFYFQPIFFGDRKAVPAAIATLEEFQTRDPKAACIMVGNGITGEMGAKIYKETTQKGEQLITDKVSEV